ncbi:MAG TPA: hypothetical protein VFB55_12695, partial [Verrucomicrobiae bacterium]|nr:hypothetical protein [Verrucomicrobiae bacterium]
MGGPYAGYVDGSTNVASFNFPAGLALTPAGDSLFIADCTNDAVRWFSDLNNPSASQVYTFVNAGNGISRPVAVVVDGATNVYVLNRGNGANGCVLEFTNNANFFDFPDYGPLLAWPAVTNNTFPLTNATAMALGGSTNLYVVCNSNQVVRVAIGGVSSVIASGTNSFGTNGPTVNLRGITLRSDGRLALSDAGNNGIWLLTPTNNAVASKFTGFHGAGDTNGPPFLVAFNHPENIAAADGGWLVVADRYNHKIKTIDAAGNVRRLFGVSSNLWWGGAGSLDPDGHQAMPGLSDGLVDSMEELGSVQAREPVGLAIAPNGTVYDTEVYYGVIRAASATGLSNTNGVSTTVPPLFNAPNGIALDSAGANLFIADKSNNVIEELNFGNNQTTPYLGAADGILYPVDVAVDASNNLYVLNQGTGGNGSILEFDPFKNLLAVKATGLTMPTAMTLDGYGNIFVAGRNGQVWAFGSGISNQIAGVTNAGVDLEGIALFDDGTIAVSDAGNQVIWQINPITKVVSLLSGQIGVSGNTLGTTNFAKFNSPHKIIRVAGNLALVADTGNNRLVVMNRAGAVTNALVSTNSLVWFGRAGDPVVPGNDRFVSMSAPIGLAVGANGTVYDSEATYIRGLQNTGLSGPAPGPFDVLPYFSGPGGVALDSGGSHLFIADPAD